MTDEHDLTAETEVLRASEDKVTVGYTRKQGLPNYSSHEVSLFLTIEGVGNPDEWLAANGQQKLDKLKAHAYDGLGLDYTLDDQHRPVLIEKQPAAQAVAQPMPNYAPPVQQAPPMQPAPMPQQGMPQPPLPNPTAPGGVATVGVYANHPVRCLKCGNTEFWDNRADVDQRIQEGKKVGPDWKCKNQQCKNGTFRDGTYTYNKTAGQGNQAVQQAVQNVEQAFTPPPAAHVPPDDAPF